MGYRVRIIFTDPEQSTVHRIQNFGEDLWRAFENDKRVSISIDEIDQSVGEIAYTVHNKQLRRSVQETERLLAQHLMTSEATIVKEPA